MRPNVLQRISRRPVRGPLQPSASRRSGCAVIKSSNPTSRMPSAPRSLRASAEQPIGGAQTQLGDDSHRGTFGNERADWRAFKEDTERRSTCAASD